MPGPCHGRRRLPAQPACPRKRAAHGFLPTFLTFSTLTLTAHGAAPKCEDTGPWPCTEDGCPGPTVGCADLKGDCTRTFGQVFSSPPDNLASTAIWSACKKTCNRCEDPQAAADREKCISWRQTGECSPNGKRQPQQDVGCDKIVRNGWSGYCECDSGVRAGETVCEHQPFKCVDKCAAQWAWLREQREKKKEAAGADGGAGAEEDFSADDALGKLYKRGKQFYVMGNTELALRHFREALKLDPEHTACKKDYKQAKKLAKMMEKIEGVLGKDIEGKGRQKQLEREEQYEEARVLLEDVLALSPPAVYRSSLYRDLCICSTKTRRNEEALKHCTRHESHDSGSMPAKVLLAEALLLNEKYEEAIAE